jgi:glycosyltransferase involved in cell wall biosynthesis
VVTTDVGGLKDFVEHMVTGVTTYAGDPASLAWGLLQVLRNPDLAKRLKETGYDKVQHIYNWKVIARRTYEVYQKVLQEAGMLGTEAVSSHPAEPAKVAAPAVAPGKRSGTKK